MSAGTWSYDGSFDGLLLLVRKAVDELEAPEAVANALAPEGELFALLGPAPLEFPGAAAPPSGFPPQDGAPLHCGGEKAASFIRALSGDLFDLILRIWMSEEPLEAILLGVCAEIGRRGAGALDDHGDPRVRALVQASRRVMREIHRLIGLARFSLRTDGIWSAPIEPDHNILSALVPSFARRFGSEAFAVVDARRRLAVRSEGGRIEALSGDSALALLPDREEEAEASLWRRYYASTENPARLNPGLQRRLMPMRYWKYLPELRSV
jgi:probable DNA metabolism protein